MVKTTKAMFRPSTIVFYPAHGVGVVQNTETLTVVGREHTVITIWLPRHRSTLRVPTVNLEESGIVNTSDLVAQADLQKVFSTLSGKRQMPKRTWSRRAAELEYKLQTPDLLIIAEALRDLNRSSENSEGISYSELELLEMGIARFMDIVSTGTHTPYQTVWDAVARQLKARGKRPFSYIPDAIKYSSRRTSTFPKTLLAVSDQSSAEPIENTLTQVEEPVTADVGAADEADAQTIDTDHEAGAEDIPDAAVERRYEEAQQAATRDATRQLEKIKHLKAVQGRKAK